ncbi:MAG: protein translocase subunit SecD, partial [Candidatus Ryanbacteria bacterium]|nr:protein translocase subunit SecD [Candidatus Ryanbacteria bacterium]
KWGITEWLKIPFRLGLDLKGGIHLTYSADLSKIPSGQKSEALEGLRDVIERRVNFFGVSEPNVRIERTTDEDRLLVDLAGVLDTGEAIRLIGETPYLEFRTELTTQTGSTTQTVFMPTELTGRYLDRAALQFDPTTNSPYIEIFFNDEGGKIFERLTGENIDKRIAIYLDGAPISVPVVRDKISGGRAQITGEFTPEEARLLAQRLNSGALPVPIELIAQQRIEPKQGEESLRKSFFAGIMGFLFVVLFMIFWYRLPGFIAVLALGIYAALTLTLFKLIPVTFTTAGIAGFILSIGMAVDANILIFERMREELKRSRSLPAAIEEGFARAWTSIRDSNASSIITAIILWYFGAEAVKGFALTLGLGVAISMFSAIVVTRTFLRASHARGRTAGGFLYSSGFSRTS